MVLVSTQHLIAYCERKTREILHRYGPGPRVHYHTGPLGEPPPSDAAAHVLRQRLVDTLESARCGMRLAFGGPHDLVLKEEVL